MRIKTFKAPTLKEAMANVKAELGIDAVILHTTRSKKGGLLGFGSKEVVEVIAAVEDEPQQKPVKRAPEKKSAPRATKAPQTAQLGGANTGAAAVPKSATAKGTSASEPMVPPIVKIRVKKW